LISNTALSPPDEHFARVWRIMEDPPGGDDLTTPSLDLASRVT